MEEAEKLKVSLPFFDLFKEKYARSSQIFGEVWYVNHCWCSVLLCFGALIYFGRLDWNRQCSIHFLLFMAIFQFRCACAMVLSLIVTPPPHPAKIKAGCQEPCGIPWWSAGVSNYVCMANKSSKWCPGAKHYEGNRYEYTPSFTFLLFPNKMRFLIWYLMRWVVMSELALEGKHFG